MILNNNNFKVTIFIDILHIDYISLDYITSWLYKDSFQSFFRLFNFDFYVIWIKYYTFIYYLLFEIIYWFENKKDEK